MGFEVRNNTVYLGRKRLGVISWREKTFRTYRKFSIHYFRMYEGWGVNARLLYFLKKKGVVWVEIRDTETGDIYKARVQDFLEKGVYYKNNKMERDGQYVLPVAHMQFTMTRPDRKQKILKMMGGRS